VFGATNLYDIPVLGDYDDDGKAELAVFRPSTAQWIILGSSAPITFGSTNLSNIPLEGVFGSLVKLGVI
jgi:hypothetical protein